MRSLMFSRWRTSTDSVQGQSISYVLSVVRRMSKPSSPDTPSETSRSEQASTSSSSDSSKEEEVSSSKQPTTGSSHWMEMPPRSQHWLDKRLPGARQWLEDKNRALWIKGLQERRRQYPFLQGREDFIAEQVENTYRQYLQKYADRVSDERSQTHLQVGCLVLATHKVLQPWIRNSEVMSSRIQACQRWTAECSKPGMLKSHLVHVQDVQDIIRAQMVYAVNVSKLTPQPASVSRFLLRYTLYLSRDPFLSTARRLKGLRLDMGTGFRTELIQTEREAELQVSDCFYYSLFASEDAEHLASCSCCSQDSVWFKDLHPHGVLFERRKWLADGDSCCSLVVRATR